MRKVLSGILGAAFLLFCRAGDVAAMASRIGSAEDLGFGVALGQPFGVTMKYWTSSTSAIDAMMGYHFNSNFDVHADYLVHSYSSFDVSNGRLPIYAGLGARINLGNDSQLGMRLPIGASYLPAGNPIEWFVEIAPVVRLVTKIGFDMDGVVGIRFYVN
jgi:hypothetical protein